MRWWARMWCSRPAWVRCKWREALSPPVLLPPGWWVSGRPLWCALPEGSWSHRTYARHLRGRGWALPGAWAVGCGLWAACGWGWPGLRLVPRRGQKGVQKAYSTRYSQAVSHPSTNQARPCLASEIRRDRARSGWYGRRRGRPSPTSPKSLLRSLSRPPGPPGPPPPHARQPVSPESRVPSPQPRAQTTESPHLRKLPARRVRPSARPSALPEPHPHAPARGLPACLPA